ncbi:MAG: hypothetical protein ACRD2O_08040, partial [Terriglobia bacterium]
MLNPTNIPPRFQTGKLHSTGWNGCLIEAEKGLLSSDGPLPRPILLAGLRTYLITAWQHAICGPQRHVPGYRGLEG